MSLRVRVRGGLLASGCLLLLFVGENSWAGVTLDGTMGAAGPVTGPDYIIPDTVGQTRGANLFHSFGQFSLTSNESATFTGPSSIQNVISRVTGGGVSSIDGRLCSQIPNANFYLINPSGIVFGPNAQLDVSGSFHASTADYLRLADGGRFDARDPGASILTVAPPGAFGFLAHSPAPIEVQGSSLAVPSGKGVSLVGGNVTMTGSRPGVSTLAAPSGRIDIVSVASAGEAKFTPDGVDVGSFAAFGAVAMTNTALLNVSGDPGGSIVIRGGRLTIDNSGADFSQTALYSALNAASTGATDHPGTAIDIQLTGDMVMHGAEISASSFGTGRGGNVRVDSDTLTLIGQAPTAVEPFGRSATIVARAFAEGKGGDISLAMRELNLRDGAAVTTEVLGAGDGGDINVTARSLNVSGTNYGAAIATTTNATGNAGSLTVSADAITLRGGMGGLTGLTTQVTSNSGASANAGELSISTNRLDVLDGAQINSGIFGGSGVGGHVQITSDKIFLSGRNPAGFPSGIFSTVDGIPTTGVGGNVDIKVGELQMADGAEIAASAGLTQGGAGNISIAANDISLQSGAIITSQTFGTRSAGNTIIEANRISLTGPSSAGQFTGIFALAGVNGGDAGAIDIRTGELELRDGAQIDSSTSGPGAGGAIDIRADRVVVAGHDDTNERRSSIGASTRVFSIFSAFATGRGGDVNITAGSVELRDRGLITVESDSKGSGGNLRITADNVSLSAGSSISATSSATGAAGGINVAADTLTLRDSDISTRADQADGGNLTIAARALLHLYNSSITSSVSGGLGNGGNISIDPNFVVLRSSRIAADAFGGNGGNVSIVAGQFVASPDSTVTASSMLGLEGNVVIRAPSEDISGEIERLPENVIDASSLFKSGCAAVGSGYSRFTTSSAGTATGAYLSSDYSDVVAANRPEATASVFAKPIERVALTSSLGCEQ